jgi:hypothetical protein
MIVFTPGVVVAGVGAGAGAAGRESADAVPSDATPTTSKIDRKTYDMPPACRTVRAHVHRGVTLARRRGDPAVTVALTNPADR